MQKDRAMVMEANIDDLSPQIYDYLLELLLENGAKDAWLENIIMKKGRPAIKLCVICEQKDKEKMAKLIFRETTTIGIRIFPAERLKLGRKIINVKTKFGEIPAKLSEMEGIRTITPEYDDCKRVAKARKIPLKDVINEVRLKAEKVS